MSQVAPVAPVAPTSISAPTGIDDVQYRISVLGSKLDELIRTLGVITIEIQDLKTKSAKKTPKTVVKATGSRKKEKSTPQVGVQQEHNPVAIVPQVPIQPPFDVSQLKYPVDKKHFKTNVLFLKWMFANGLYNCLISESSGTKMSQTIELYKKFPDANLAAEEFYRVIGRPSQLIIKNMRERYAMGLGVEIPTPKRTKKTEEA